MCAGGSCPRRCWRSGCARWVGAARCGEARAWQGEAPPVCAHRCDDNRHTSRYPWGVRPFRWSAEKNELLESERGITFERIVVAIANDDLLDEIGRASCRERVYIWVGARALRQQLVKVCVGG